MKNITKKIVIGGLLLALGGCSSLRYRNTDCHQENIAPSRTEETTSSPEKYNREKTLIVLSPHFDDAVLSIGGIIAEFDGPKYIVSFFSTPTTTTQYLTWWDEKSGFTKSTDARETREQENKNAAHLLGARVINLDYVDNQYEIRSSSDSTSLVEAIKRDIEDIIGSMPNAQITIVGPSYFGETFTHPDHLVVSKALVQAVQQARYANTHFYFYEDLPYTHKRFGKEEITLDTLLTAFYSGLCVDTREIFPSAEAFDLKLEGIKLYLSQVILN